jgi:hypothetical protein
MFLFWLNFVSNAGIRSEMRIKRIETLEDATKLEPPIPHCKGCVSAFIADCKIEFPVRATRNPQEATNCLVDVF